MQIQTPKRHYTPAEYLQLEETAEFKNEYRDGEIVTINSLELILSQAKNDDLQQFSGE